MAEYGLYKREWQKWLRARQKRAPFKPGETVTTLLKEFKASPSGVNIPPTTAMQYFQDLFGKGALIPKYPELESLTVEYIKTKLKAGKTMDMIKNEWARENNLWDKISKGRSQTYKNPFDSMVQLKITDTIKANPELTQLLNIIKTNQDADLNLKRYNKFIKDNIGKYKAADGTYKSGFRENLYNDALKFFKKNYPGSVQTAFALRGGQKRIPPGAEFIRIKSGPGATATSYEHGRQRIRDVAEAKMPTSVGKKGRLHTYKRLTTRDVTAAESLGMTQKAYKNAIARNLLYPLGKLFPTLYRSKDYAPSAEHAYPLQQAIATNMAGEIKAGSKGIYPSTKKMNIFIKGPRLDSKVTTQLRLAYEAADPKIKKRYLNTANELISKFKKEFPGKYPRYGLTGRNNIVNLNPPGPGLLKAPLSSKVTGYIDALIQTPGFLESPELKGLPSEAQTLIKSRSTPKYNTLLNNFISVVKKSGGCRYLTQSQGGGAVATCPEIIRRDPVGSANKLATMEATSGALGKVKNAATTFLGTLGKFGTKAAPLAALAVAGAGIEPLVKFFRNDDPSTYLTDESQMKGMLLATIEGETPKVDQELLNWQYPGMAASAAAAVPGSSALMKARKAKGFGAARAALGPVGKFLAGTFSPLGVAATLPISVAAQRKGGTEWGDIATDPLNWMAPAFASTGARMATRGMAPTGILAKALRMGMSPRTLSLVSRRFGMPGLAISAGMWGYDKWKNRSINDED